jgi:hypothetical protein
MPWFLASPATSGGDDTECHSGAINGCRRTVCSSELTNWRRRTRCSQKTTDVTRHEGVAVGNNMNILWTYYEHIMNMKIQEDKPLWHYGSIWIVPSEHNGGHRKYFLKWFRYAFQYEAKPLNLEVKLASRLPSLCCLCSDCRAAENSAKMVVSIRWHVISTCLEHHKKKQMLKSSKRSSSGLSI